MEKRRCVLTLLTVFVLLAAVMTGFSKEIRAHAADREIFALEQVSYDPDTGSAVAELTASSDCRLVFGMYDAQTGAMLENKHVDVAGSRKPQEVFQPVDVGGRGRVLVKAFLLDPISWAPLCAAADYLYDPAALREGFAAPTEENTAYDAAERVHYVTDTLLVIFEDGTSEETVRQVAAQVGGTPIGFHAGLKLYQLRVPAASLQKLMADAEALEENACVRRAVYDRITMSMVSEADYVVPDDPWDGKLVEQDWTRAFSDGSNWWAAAVKLPYAWTHSEAFSNIKIGICDASFDPDHEDLKNKLRFVNRQAEKNNVTTSWWEDNSEETQSPAQQYDAHGTHVAGIIGAEANNKTGITGVLDKAELLVSPLPHCSTVELVCGIYDLVAAGAKVINLSLGESEALTDGLYSEEKLAYWADLYANVMAYLLEDGYDFLVVNAAGNGNSANEPVDAMQNGLFCSITEATSVDSDAVSIRDVLDRIIVVGSAENRKYTYMCSRFSNTGAQVDICAPGTDVYSTLPHETMTGQTNAGGYGTKSGTSMAAPVVSGVCGMVWSARPELTGAEVRHLVCCSTKDTVVAHDHAEDRRDYPLLNAQLAVESVLTDPEKTVPVTVHVCREDGTPVAEMTVTDYTSGRTARTNVDGTAVFFLEPGRSLITATSDGWYGHQVVEIGRRITVNITVKETFFEWSLDESGTCLTINGWGPMPDYSYLVDYSSGINRGDTPWGHKLTKVEITGVASIGAYAFAGCTALTEVSIPDTVAVIAYCAFRQCTALQTLEIPGGVYAAGKEAFYGCAALQDLTVRYGITDMGEKLFYNCDSLVSVRLPDSVRSVQKYAFSDCANLRSAELSQAMKQLPEHLFSACRSLETVVLPAELTSIGKYAFYNCEKLSLDQLPDSLVSIGQAAFYCCNGLTELAIPGTVREFGDGAFGYCYGLKTVVLEEGVTSVGSSAFEDCENLTEVSFAPSVSAIGFNAFKDCRSLKQVEIPGKVQAILGETFSGCTSLESVEIPDGMILIDACAFAECKALQRVDIPGSVIAIGERAFESCTSLTEAVIGDGTKYLGEYVFCDCDNLCAVTLPDSITQIGICAFLSSGVVSVDLPDGLTEISDRLFDSCAYLTSVQIPDGVTKIGSSAFAYCSSLRAVSIPAGVTVIGTDTFECCVQLTGIVIPDSVAAIGTDAFSGCTSLAAVTLPATLTTLEEGLFSSCTSLRQISLPPLVTYIGEMAFYEAGLEQLQIPRGVRTIAADAFEHCISLQSIWVPIGVELNRCFYRCFNVKNLYFEGTEEQWQMGKYALGYGCDPEIYFEQSMPYQ